MQVAKVSIVPVPELDGEVTVFVSGNTVAQLLTALQNAISDAKTAHDWETIQYNILDYQEE